MNTFSSQSNYYTPTKSREQLSTADKFYDLEASEKQYQELVSENIWLRQQMGHSRMTEAPQQHCHQCSCEEQTYPDVNTHAVRHMLDRNQYLQEKIEKLKHQYSKQNHSISAIKSSQKWRSRFECNNSNRGNCYESKYMQLLRVKSPCLLYTSPSPRDLSTSRMPSSA